MRGHQSAVEGSVHQRITPPPRREVVSVLLGAAEICLLERSPRLAIRAAWHLLKSAEMSNTGVLTGSVGLLQPALGAREAAAGRRSAS
jgi:hypothetical protein